MNDRPGEQPLPFYGLSGFSNCERLIVGEGWDVNSVAHRSGTSAELIVGVDRRTTFQRQRGVPRVAISEDRARESVATALASQLPDAGCDLYGIATEVAQDDRAWKKCTIQVDGEPVSGYERQYQGMWVAYYLTPVLIVFVLAPAVLRPGVIHLETIESGELRRRED